MKKYFFITLFSIISLAIFGQISNEISGSVSFISSQNVYVKFTNTSGINEGDTLYVSTNNKLFPALLVNSMSSISCVGTPIGKIQLSLSTTLIAIKKNDLPLEVKIEKSNEPVAVTDLIPIVRNDSDKIEKEKSELSGRFSVSSYSNFASNPMSLSTPNFRLRYNLALNISHIAKTNLSFENYMSYTHTLNNPLEKFKDLKVYNLAFKYDFDKNTSIAFGRKINVNTSNIGAVDGLQFEKKIKNYTVGALLGTRPNDTTYSFDAKLFQYGFFVNHHFDKKFRSAQTTIAFFNQTNSFKTDRRYLYLQHSNTLLKNLDLFGSAEVDLYAIENNQAITDFDLTSLYLSLSYRPVKNLSLSMTYDTRKNVYYYQTYKNRIDSLLEKETRQGLRFRFNYRPFKYFSWGGNAGYRLHSPYSTESLNAISYLTYSNLPWINSSLTLTGTALKTANITGYIFGASMSRDFLDGKLAAEFEYRKALIFTQDIAELSLFWRISKSLMLSTDFELTLESDNMLSRVFVNLSKRF